MSKLHNIINSLTSESKSCGSENKYSSVLDFHFSDSVDEDIKSKEIKVVY